MVYKIRVRIIDTTPVKFSVVEKSVWYHVGGTWSECDGIHTITMNGIGSSGALRFSNAHNESFIVVAGLMGPGEQHWSAIVTDLGVDHTALWIHPGFYGEVKHPWTSEKEETKRSEKGTQVTTRLVAQAGNEYFLHVIIYASDSDVPRPNVVMKICF
ncbi:fungal fruit body lectin [Laetiporus sulphureus 93-53]|uniref:Fungal fruit body lectin n=1 Tax=Laetiporus sulphureus 93-53 TaxID=1314785 RepID=A0A165CYL8_9APHY|nr:fungal fruit body lectin [Laetiporus sulphureus 93-53]KZT03758.1 fungal fruit body lectin [Laetiporus sulphureus 93-53]